MRTLLTILFPILLLSPMKAKGSKEDVNIAANNRITIRIGSASFTATLEDNATAKAFKSMLPLTINMSDHNRNEKYWDMPKALPTSASNPGTIHNGDLMLWGSRTFVIFYQTFSTSYSYTRIGRIDNPTKLTEALGARNVSVIFEKSPAQ